MRGAVKAHPRVDVGPECWEWKGARNQYGYGIIRHEGRVLRAHRWAWSLVNGPIPEGLVVMHSCDNRGCVNPDHLSVGTQADNLRDMWAKGRAGGTPAAQAVATHCSQGHEFTPENIQRGSRGERLCKTCRRSRSRKYRESRKTT